MFADRERPFSPAFSMALVEGEAVGQAGQAVAQHLGAQVSSRSRPRSCDQRVNRQRGAGQSLLGRGASFSRKKCAATPSPSLEIELAGLILAVEEVVQKVGDRTRPEAFGLIPVERGAIRIAATVSTNRLLCAETLRLSLSARSMIAAAIGRASSKLISSTTARCGVAFNLSVRRRL